MRNEYPTSRVAPAVGSVLMYLAGILVIGSATLKFVQPPAVVVQFRELGYEGTKLILIGILEICCSLLFMIPYTRSIGLLLLSAYLGGAIATHVGHGQPAALGPAVLLTLAWLGVSLRHPNIFWSFRTKS
jgi:uncharacterized membrane protein YphA (DoxX/SURF4 family)